MEKANVYFVLATDTCHLLEIVDVYGGNRICFTIVSFLPIIDKSFLYCMHKSIDGHTSIFDDDLSKNSILLILSFYEMLPDPTPFE